MRLYLTLILCLVMLTGCAAPQPDPISASSQEQDPTSTQTTQANLPNPASAFCEQQGYKLEILTAADGSQSGVCIFPDGSECDEWAYYRGECGPSSSGEAISPPANIPTPLPVDLTDTQGWQTYSHPVDGFSLLLPEDWIVEEAPESDALMSGHLLNLRPKDEMAQEHIRMTFRRAGEETLLWPTGVGQGEFFTQGTLDVAGQPALRLLLVCPTGEVTSIWYHQAEDQANIVCGGMEFGFIFHAGATHCEAGYSLSGKTLRIGETIIASLQTQ